jgi:hypothetical protein
MDLIYLFYKKFIHKSLTKLRKWLLLVLSGDMRVMINCDVYDDVVEYNSKEGECFIERCRVDSLDKYLNSQIDRYEMNRRKGVSVRGNAFVLTDLGGAS